MNDPRLTPSDDQLQFLQDLLEEHATIAGGVVEVGDACWAIHGFIPVDGDILMARFYSYDRAAGVLEQLPRLTRPHDRP